ncbi:MAG TPA: hypothetical protein VKB50_24280 [Vicinamibacterales bacterium]|nr:hypothetical protein [Vicinamibacterales bacterium]
MIIASACGKKGPPLPPIVHIPTEVDHLSARRVGNDVFLTLTVPAQNIDKTTPADVGRVEVYGYTGTSQPPRARFLEVATLVATVPVLPPESEAQTSKKPATSNGSAGGNPPAKETSQTGQAPPSARAKANPQARQGAMVTVQERLTPESIVARPLPAPAPAPRSSRTTSIAPASTAAPEGAFRRFYVAIAFSARGRPGPPSMFAELPLMPLPDPPRDVVAKVTPEAISLSWEPAGGLIGFLLEHPLAIESSPIDEPSVPGNAVPGAAVPGGAAPVAPANVPEGPTRYNVYREIEPPPGTVTTPEPEAPTIAVPINPAPLSVLSFSEPVPLLDGRTRCYTVRSIRGSGASTVESEDSMPSCVTLTDDVPPAAPVALSSTVEPGAISLSWAPSTEADLAGYVVLRGAAGDATLTPLTGSVITDAMYVDRTVRPGVRYVYAVQAIDTHLPTPNVSAESERVEETAR